MEEDIKILKRFLMMYDEFDCQECGFGQERRR